ncbi:MAG TPA: hypothetical protein VHG28_24735, partial [Longimicrobiaceae bacterium]|nr:hypothetical protein [Longimicrobiaceae bacterium]
IRGAPRRLAAGLLVFAAGCGDDDGTGPTPLSPEEVAGVYRICSLAFAPSSRFLPAVDIRARAFDTASVGVTPPRLKLDATWTFELEYTPRGQFTDVEHRGTFATGASRVRLAFARPAEVAPLLLPERVDAEFDAASRLLRIADSGLPFTVSKGDYEWLLGESDPGIPPRVEGRLTGRFTAGACP